MFRHLAVAIVVVGMTAATLAAQAPQGKTVWDGVYTDVQATRGKDAYDANCARCHREDLSGGQGPALTGERREQLLKLVGEKLEETRISSRKARDETWKDIQTQERAGKLSEDEKFRLKDDLQKKIDAFNKELDVLTERKKTEIQS